MTRRLQILSSSFAILFGLVALTASYWGIVASSELLARDDNPRLVDAELRIQRGSILDRNGIVLAETRGEPGALERVYNGIGVYSPAVGYYSLRFGVSGVEDSYDDVLRGRESDPWREWWNNFVHRDPIGQDLRLTLDVEVQAAADAALGEWKGAVVVLNARNGEILGLVSHPTYNPNQLDEQFDVLNADEDAPLLSRSTQARYQPGTSLLPLILAAMLETGMFTPNAHLEGLYRSVPVGNSELACAESPPADEGTVSLALAYSCPAPFVELATQASGIGLSSVLEDLGLYAPPPVPLDVAPGSQPALDLENRLAEAEAVGQGQLTLSPLQMAWAMAALANEGTLPSLRLVRRIGSSGIVVGKEVEMAGLSTDTADQVMTMLKDGIVSGAARQAAIEGVDVAGHVGMAISGPSGEQNIWFLGIAPAEIPEPFARYVVVVLMEGATDPTAAALAGRQVLQAVIDLR
jgi:peptidoglycan glycosyltransferase